MQYRGFAPNDKEILIGAKDPGFEPWCHRGGTQPPGASWLKGSLPSAHAFTELLELAITICSVIRARVDIVED